MKIETAHKILIGTAIAVSLVYALFELSRWRSGGGGGAVLRAGLGIAAAGGFAVYLRWYIRSVGPRDGRV